MPPRISGSELSTSLAGGERALARRPREAVCDQPPPTRCIARGVGETRCCGRRVSRSVDPRRQSAESRGSALCRRDIAGRRDIAARAMPPRRPDCDAEPVTWYQAGRAADAGGHRGTEYAQQLRRHRGRGRPVHYRVGGGIFGIRARWRRQDHHGRNHRGATHRDLARSACSGWTGRRSRRAAAAPRSRTPGRSAARAAQGGRGAEAVQLVTAWPADRAAARQNWSWICPSDWTLSTGPIPGRVEVYP